MSDYRAAQEIGKLSKMLCENEKVRNVANKIGPKVANVATSIATGNPVAGLTVDVAMTAASETNPRGTAEMITGLALCPVAVAASIVATPVLVGVLVVEGVKSLLGKE